MKCLLEHDADVSISLENSGDTPLHIAVRNKNKDIIKLLIWSKASIKTKNKKQQTPLDLCGDDKELYEYILKNVELQNEQNAQSLSTLKGDRQKSEESKSRKLSQSQTQTDTIDSI